MEDAGPLCPGCADLDHMVYLPAGDAALTRRARKAGDLSAVVVRFSRARRRYERQGILIEEAALEQAEEDSELQAGAAREILRLYPGCPRDRAEEISHHAFSRGSGRVGRTAAGRDLDQGALTLAVAAAIRHMDTPYDELLMAGIDRLEARALYDPRWSG